MRILAITQGLYGNRIAENLRSRGPENWIIETFIPPRGLPVIIDDPEEFLPATMPHVELILLLSESSQVAQLISGIANLTNAKAVIAPIDNSSWLPPGLKSQLKQDLAEIGVAAVFPKTFCTLTENECGFRNNTEPYQNEIISSFARHFGRPKFKITVGQDKKIVKTFEVIRGAPCGSTHHAANQMVGRPVDEVKYSAGLVTHHYPCLASMQQEVLDDNLYDTLMHLSGYVVNDEVEKAIQESA